MFQIPHFGFWNVIFTAIGAAVYWGKAGRTKLRAYYLSDLIAKLPINENARAVLEFLVFVALGSLVGVAVVQPLNPTQAITAGLGWTGLFARH
jgi:hypothetical protein